MSFKVLSVSFLLTLQMVWQTTWVVRGEEQKLLSELIESKRDSSAFERGWKQVWLLESLLEAVMVCVQN